VATPHLGTVKSAANLRRLNHEAFIQVRDLVKNRSKIEEPRATYNVIAQYDESDNLLFRGCLQNGIKNGYGKEYHLGTKIIKYEGVFKNNKYHGTGKLYTPQGIMISQGTYQFGEIDGQGSLYYPMGHLQYKGQISLGVYTGQGSYYHKNGKVLYLGDFAEGERYGYGKEYTVDGLLLYEGSFECNEYNGKGTLHHKNGHKFLAGVFGGG
jgi:antitoxin component YwqK of YwqJK toxin-antitoxin module